MKNIKITTGNVVLSVILLFICLLTGCGSTQASVSEPSSLETTVNSEQTTTDTETELSVSAETESTAETGNETASDSTDNLQIQVEANGSTIVFELNDSSAAKSLYDQLPLTIEVQNYSSDEKIFYPLEALDTSDTSLANAVAGTLAYFEPWGDVVMYYDDFGSYSGLYELGQVVSGKENIEALSGEITISKIE